LRLNTGGSATDHKVNWPACGKFSASTEPGQLVTRESQLAQIKEQLLAGKRITVQSVLKTVHTQELRTYIPILRRAGLPIMAVWVSKGDKRFKEYYLQTA
jgi:hypothetical protein